MHLTLTKNTTKTLLQGMRKVISKKTTLPVLEHLLVESGEGGQVFVTGDNLNERLTFRVPDAEIADASGGAFLLPFDELKSVVGNLKKHDVLHVDPEGDRVILTRESEGIRVPHIAATMPADEFPINQAEIGVSGSNPQPVLQALKALSVFASTDQNRRVLNGVFCDSQNKRMVSTDGRRLGLMELGTAFPFDQDAVLPVTQVLKNGILSGEDGGVTVAEVGEKELERQILAVHAGPWQYQVRCIDGRYANYEQVIPSSVPHSPRIDLKESNLSMLRNVLKQFSPNGADKYAVLYADANGVSLVLPQDSEGTPFAPIAIPGAESKNVATNASVWFPAAQMIDAFSAGYHELEITGTQSPVRFTGLDNSLLVVMPGRECDNESLIEFMGGEVPEEARSETPEEATPTAYGDEPQSTQAEGADDMASPENQTQAEAQSTAGSNPNPEPDDRDSLTVFMDQLSDTQEKVRDANSAVRDLKKSAKQLEREFKDREKDIRSREREFEKNARLIQQLQQTVAGEHRKAA